MKSGIKPIPNIIIGFPEESFESIRATMDSHLKLGIHCKPHFATAYPGSEWYYVYKDSIINQYDGDLEKYILDLGDATKLTGTISHRFSPMDLLGLQQIVALRDLRLLSLSESHWGRSDDAINSHVTPQASNNFIRSNIKTPTIPVLKEQIVRFPVMKDVG